VRRALFFRTEHVPFRIEPDAGQVPEHVGQSVGDVASDILEKSEPGPRLTEHPEHIRPKVPLVLCPELVPCDAERLARLRVARRDEINDPTPRATVESSQVRVDRSSLKHPVLHSRSQIRRDIGFPFHVTDRSSPAGGRESEPELDPSKPGT